MPVGPEVPGGLPDGWSGLDGWVANSIITVSTTFNGVPPGNHTLKVSCELLVLFPAKRSCSSKDIHDSASCCHSKNSDWCVRVAYRIIFLNSNTNIESIDTSGLRASYLGPPESILV